MKEPKLPLSAFQQSSPVRDEQLYQPTPEEARRIIDSFKNMHEFVLRIVPERTTLQHIVRGCGHLEHVGPHPGTFWYFVVILFAVLHGSTVSWQRGLLGFFVAALITSPMFLSGAYMRSKMDDEMEKEANESMCAPTDE